MLASSGYPALSLPMLQPRLELLRAPRLPAPQKHTSHKAEEAFLHIFCPVVNPFSLSRPNPWPDIMAADTHIPAQNWPPRKTPDSS